MSTKARIWYPNTSFHITARGNRRNDIFRDDEDFQIYLTLMENSLEHFQTKFNRSKLGNASQGPPGS